jgi:hypothetical protein
MSERGFIAVARGSMDHSIIGVAKPYSAYEAWHWMLFAAAYKNYRVIASNGNARAVVNLNRGQMSHSLRFMAKAWGWSIKRVRTFLSRLEMDTQIDTQRDGLQTLITIRNYDRYQTPGHDTETQTGTQTTTQGARKGHKEEQGNKETKEREGADAPKPTRIKREKKNATQMPLDFQPNLEAAKAVGLSRGEAEREFLKFKNWAAAKAQAYVDWQAAWRNWCINAARYLKKPPPKSSTVAMTITPKSRSWNAWKSYFRDNGMNGRAAIMDKCADEDRPFTVESEWPPGYEVDDAA